VIWGDEGEVRSFQDRWAGGIDHYIAWFKEQVIEMHRVLKSTGSIFLHCDWHADAYIRVEILDRIFGMNHLINQFVWKRSSNRSSISKAARKNYGTVFFYSKSGQYTFNLHFTELSKTSKDLYKHEDEKGFYQLVPLLVSGIRNGETGKVWMNVDPNKQGKEGMHWITTPDKLDQYRNEGLIYFPANGVTPQLKYYLEQSPGAPLSEVWDDIRLVQGKEVIGYPTQNPFALNELSRDASGIREIEFIAAGRSEAGIEFYSWDFDYDAEKGFRASVIIDREGNRRQQLKAGVHHIAVKAVDNDGLESIETIKLKVNGTVERT
jgi:hypothetical protein